MTDVITNVGLSRTLANNFPGASEVGKFGYMAIGTSSTEPTANSAGLGSECDPVLHTDYHRVAITATFEPEYNRVLLEGVFTESNITTSATITEVGIVNQETIDPETDAFFCIAQVPAMPKKDGIQLKIVVTIGMEQVAVNSE